MENQDENMANENQGAADNQQAPEGKGPIIGVIIIIIILALASFYVFSTREEQPAVIQEEVEEEDDWFIEPPVEEEMADVRQVLPLTAEEFAGLTEEEIEILSADFDIEITD